MELIKREDAIKAIVNTPSNIADVMGNNLCLDGAVFRQNEIIDILKDIPSVEKKGEWIPNSPYTGLCSECGGEGNLKNNFCPNCGNPNTEEAMRILASRYHNCDARMKGADDDRI